MEMIILLAIVALVITVACTKFHRIPRGAHVVDGDTIDFAGRRWRIKGYDAPEWNQPSGREASAALRRIIRTEDTLAIAFGFDIYGRGLCSIHTRRGPLAWRMTAAGHGHGEGFICTLLTFVARIGRRGLWQGTDVMHPKTWRAIHPHY